jgi:hypothetical protein
MHPQRSQRKQRVQSNRVPSAERRHTMPNMPVRLVTPATNTPYPIHDSQASTIQQHMVDLLSGQRFQRTDAIRQPLAADFLPSHRPLPNASVRRYDSDQDLPVTEPGSYFPKIPAGNRRYSRPQSFGAAYFTQRESVTSLRPLQGVTSDPIPPVSAVNVPAVEAENSAVEENSEPAPMMNSDTFSPALGGLHRLDSAPVRRPSRFGRLKRLFSAKDRPYGRAAR